MRNEITVSLVLSGFGCDPDEITRSTGLRPDEIWRQGDPVGRTIRFREDNGWRIQSGTTIHTNMNEQIIALLERIRPAADTLARLAEICYLEIACALRAYEYVPEMHLEKATVFQIAQLGAELDIDLYCLMDDKAFLGE